MLTAVSGAGRWGESAEGLLQARKTIQVKTGRKFFFIIVIVRKNNLKAQSKKPKA